jgi:phosphatidylglycerophosphate synthase
MAGKSLQRFSRPLRVAVWLSGIAAVIATPWADGFLDSDAIWEFKVSVCLVGGLAVSAAWLCFPKESLARIEANLITVGRFFLFWFGVYVFLRWSVYAGHLLVVSSPIWDVLDGKAEVARRERGLPRSKLNRWIGKWLDPLVDKITVLPLVAYFALHGVIGVWVVAPVVLFDAIGTCLREPVTTLFRFFRYPSSITWRARLDAEIERSLAQESLASDGKRKRDESRASAIGKVKALVQCLGLEVCMPFYLGWLGASRIPDYVYSAAAVLGALSVLSRHIPPNRFLAWANSHFRHQDVL